jgi:hypothetical protein
MNTKNLVILGIGYRKFVLELPVASMILDTLREVEEFESKNFKDDNGDYQTCEWIKHSGKSITIESLTEARYLAAKLTDGDNL